MSEGAATAEAPAGAEQRNATALPDRQKLTDDIIAALRTVYDPEIPVNLYDLGLIYRIEPKGRGVVEIDMTLTAPGCPVAGEMVSMVQKAVLAVPALSSVNVNLVFDPPWDKSRMSEDVQLELGLL
jgi:FeS assembly SUF system protein